MQIRKPLSLAVASFTLLASSSALAMVDIEITGGQSNKILKGDEGEEDVSVLSNDMNLYLGYRFKSFPLSFGLLVTQKNYDIAEYSKEFAGTARSFYEDPSLFPSPADITSAESSGSWKGLVYGPQVSISMGWKYFDPYLRFSYQVGTLKSVIDYKSSGNYMGNPVAYDYSIENDLKASFMQYGVGFRIPLTMKIYILGDYGIEKLKAESGDQTFKVRSLQAKIEQTDTETYTDGGTSEADGSVFRAGLGLSF